MPTEMSLPDRLSPIRPTPRSLSHQSTSRTKSELPGHQVSHRLATIRLTNLSSVGRPTPSDRSRSSAARFSRPPLSMLRPPSEIWPNSWRRRELRMPPSWTAWLHSSVRSTRRLSIISRQFTVKLRKSKRNLVSWDKSMIQSFRECIRKTMAKRRCLEDRYENLKCKSQASRITWLNIRKLVISSQDR